MTEVDLIGTVLDAAGYTHFLVDNTDLPCIGFENDLSFGFLFCYPTTESLLQGWKNHNNQILSRYQFQLRSDGEKSWNAYSIFFWFVDSDNEKKMLLTRIEEDLSGTRKIARAVAAESDGIRSGLLPLLNIQNPPILGPVDMVEEIRARASDLPVRAVDAFLENAPNGEILRLMGRSSET
jgi:hypothetical protein